MEQADFKAACLTHRFNNIKISQVAKQNQERRRMDLLLIALKRKLTKWQQLYSDQDESNKFHKMANATDTGVVTGLKDSMVINTTDKQKDEISLQQSLIEDSKYLSDEALLFGQDFNATLKNRPESAKTLKKDQTQDFKKPLQILMSIEEEDESKKSLEEELQQRKKKLNLCVIIYLWMKKNLTEQIQYITSQKQLLLIQQEMLRGKIDIKTQLERKMLKDIQDIRENALQQDNEEQEQVGLQGMERTKQFIKFGKMARHYLLMFIEIFSTYSQYVCYFFMILSMMINAGLVSLIYPILVFGFALMEESSPRRYFWNFVLIYTLVLLLVKFCYQLNFWAAIWGQQSSTYPFNTPLQDFQIKLSTYHIGLTRLESNNFGDMLGYFIPEILIIFSIMTHIQKEIQLGLYIYKQTDLETIKAAAERYILLNGNKIVDENNYDSNNEFQDEFPKIQEQNAKTSLILFQINLKRDVKNYNQIYRRSESQNTYVEEYFGEYSPLVSEDEEFPQQRLRAISLLCKADLDKVFKEVEAREKLQMQGKAKTFDKFMEKVEKLLYKNEYIYQLFPKIKAQKPGIDLYAVSTGFQFVICLFLIFFYTKMDADFTDDTQIIVLNQFSGEMVIGLFLQILIMIFDRFLYKAKTFIMIQEQQQIREKKLLQPKQADKQQMSDSTTKKLTIGGDINEAQFSGIDRKSAFSKKHRGGQSSQFQKQYRTTYKDYEHDYDTISEKEVIDQDSGAFELEHTQITFTIVLKFYLQWFLLIGVHLFVFWYFPIIGNKKLQNNAYCDLVKYKDKDSCNEFRTNWALIVFYILYCCYFGLSALQIKYGHPEIRKGNFMMGGHRKHNNWGFKGFMAIPFLFELRTFADWAFTKTSLDIFQWFNLSSAHAELFIAKCTQTEYRNHPLGEKIPWYFKLLIGGGGLAGVILLIAGPLLIFSNWNPISQINLVTDCNIAVNIRIQLASSDTYNTINLYTNNYVTEMRSIDSYEYTDMAFDLEPRTKAVDLSLIQYIKMNNNSDTNWGMSVPSKQLLKDQFFQAAQGTTTTKLYLELKYQFTRPQPSGAQVASYSEIVEMTTSNYSDVIKNFSSTFSLDCTNKDATASTYINNFFKAEIKLTEKDNAEPMNAIDNKYLKGLKIFYSCQDYWEVRQLIGKDSPERNIANSNETGIAFYTFSDKIAPSYFQYSVVTFYISIVLVVGKLLRAFIVKGSNGLFISEIPYPDPILMLCECIYIYRMQLNLEMEEELYFTFIDIMRSPEMIKTITGSSLKQKMD